MSTPDTIKCPECDHWTCTGAGGVYECLRCGHFVDRRRSDQPAAPAVTPAPAQGDTPRTDAVWAKLPFEDRYETYRQLRDNAERLERELAEAKREKLAAYMCYEGAKAELDRLAAQHARIDELRHKAESELAALRQSGAVEALAYSPAYAVVKDGMAYCRYDDLLVWCKARDAALAKLRAIGEAGKP